MPGVRFEMTRLSRGDATRVGGPDGCDESSKFRLVEDAGVEG